jgi:hypothetical protein
VLGILGRAGFHDVSLTSAELPFKLGDDLEDAVLFASRMGPAARALRDLDEATATRALEMLRQTLAPFAPGFALGSAVWVATARA